MRPIRKRNREFKSSKMKREIKNIVVLCSGDDSHDETIATNDFRECHFFIKKNGQYQVGKEISEHSKLIKECGKNSVFICISGSKANKEQILQSKLLIRSLFKDCKLDQTCVFGAWEIDASFSCFMFDYMGTIMKNIFEGG